MSTPPSADELERQLLPVRPKDLPHDVLAAVREHSKRMFGNQDRIEVVVAIGRVALDKVNATDLHDDIDVAVNRIRAQLLVLEALRLLKRTGSEHGKRMFERLDKDDPFWGFVAQEYQMIVDERLDGSPAEEAADGPDTPQRPASPARGH